MNARHTDDLSRHTLPACCVDLVDEIYVIFLIKKLTTCSFRSENHRGFVRPRQRDTRTRTQTWHCAYASNCRCAYGILFSEVRTPLCQLMLHRTQRVLHTRARVIGGRETVDNDKQLPRQRRRQQRPVQ